MHSDTTDVYTVIQKYLQTYMGTHKVNLRLIILQQIHNVEQSTQQSGLCNKSMTLKRDGA